MEQIEFLTSVRNGGHVVIFQKDDSIRVFDHSAGIGSEEIFDFRIFAFGSEFRTSVAAFQFGASHGGQIRAWSEFCLKSWVGKKFSS